MPTEKLLRYFLFISEKAELGLRSATRFLSYGTMLAHEPILHVEDDQNFADLLRGAVKRAGIMHPVIHCESGLEAQEFFLGTGKFADRNLFPLPGVALIDLKMPGMDGFELLKWIREKSPLPNLPVVVLTSSESMKEVHQAYQLGANSFLVKPPTVEDVKEIMKMLGSFWAKNNDRNPIIPPPDFRERL